MIYPANQMEFEKMFNTEQDCIDYLIVMRWPHGFMWLSPILEKEQMTI